MGELFQVGAADQLHRDEGDALGFAQVIGLGDVGVDQIGDQFGFADEVVDKLLLIGVVLANDLDGDAFDEAARPELFGFVNDAHSALIDLADNFVAKLVLDREQRHAPMLIERHLKSSSRCRRTREKPEFPWVFF